MAARGGAGAGARTELARGRGRRTLTAMEPPSSHTIDYTVLNSGYTHETGRDWSIDVAASPAELEHLAREGRMLLGEGGYS